ncbi:hypothetical protein BC938DRAFT_477712 [Jimgerdemannia flammicorona]|uniref:Uncharacterized protein n=1 Tax=Jimgerdemannia flammicorona TaxID=994334 RepID=A0A433QNY8_9FUNG|nr:hypothetical protein BC938DRAFT_477712 [Jimgerdemannia flammicorona]
MKFAIYNEAHSMAVCYLVVAPCYGARCLLPYDSNTVEYQNNMLSISVSITTALTITAIAHSSIAIGVDKFIVKLKRTFRSASTQSSDTSRDL